MGEGYEGRGWSERLGRGASGRGDCKEEGLGVGEEGAIRDTKTH